MDKNDALILEHKNRLLKAQNDYLLAENALLKSLGKVKEEFALKCIDEIYSLRKELEGVI